MTTSSGPTAPFALARYATETGSVPALVVGDRLRPLSPAELGAPSLNEFLAAGDAAWERLEPLAAAAPASPSEEHGRPDAPWMPLGSVTLLAPVEPRQVLQTGANYRTHVIDLVVAGRAKQDPRPVEELRAWAADLMDLRAREGIPYFFIGLPACVVGADEVLELPDYSEQHDWELELAVVIGSPAFRVSRDDAMAHVAGYTIVNDITTRDLVFRQDMKDIGTDWYRAKNAPGFLPTGPFLVPARHVADPGGLRVTLTVNGETMQDATTEDLLFGIPALIAAASETMPLLPGDLLLTGSPAGNGIAHGRMLRHGDVMVGTIDGLGSQVVHAAAARVPA